MESKSEQLGSMECARRALASVLVTAMTIFVMPFGAQVDASAKQQICLGGATPHSQTIAACSFVLAGAASTEPKEFAFIFPRNVGQDTNSALAAAIVVVLFFAIRAGVAHIGGDKLSKRAATALALLILVVLMASVVGGDLLIEAMTSR